MYFELRSLNELSITNVSITLQYTENKQIGRECFPDFFKRATVEVDIQPTGKEEVTMDLLKHLHRTGVNSRAHNFRTFELIPSNLQALSWSTLENIGEVMSELSAYHSAQNLF